MLIERGRDQSQNIPARSVGIRGGGDVGRCRCLSGYDPLNDVIDANYGTRTGCSSSLSDYQVVTIGLDLVVIGTVLPILSALTSLARADVSAEDEPRSVPHE